MTTKQAIFEIMTVNDSTKKLVRQRAKFLCEYIEYQETPTHPLLQFAVKLISASNLKYLQFHLV
ncbi:MAG: hypothetical protein V7K77_07715 [Nostoc sp.]|uniref:hypothetical protein n=1 Tax=Nostoc sp. TaxID=1180 RepID=UPI002FFC76ED